MVYNTFIVVKPPPISDPRVFSQPLPHTHTPGFISICFLFPSLPPQPLEAKNLSVSVCSYRSWILQISEIIQHTDFSVWFFSLSAIFFLNIFIFLRTRVFACMYVFVPYARSACGGQKKASDPWELESQTVESHQRVLGFKPGSSERASSAFNHLELIDSAWLSGQGAPGIRLFLTSHHSQPWAYRCRRLCVALTWLGDQAQACSTAGILLTEP